MRAEGRLILDGKRCAAENMGVDEALLMMARESGEPTLRLYGWEPSAVSIGYFQRVEDEVNLEATGRDGVDVVRRITGGGAVYHDTHGEVTYSVVLPFSAGGIPREPRKIYEMVGAGLIEGLRALGLKAALQGINDVAIGNRKISGSALIIKPWGALQHGTILIEVDPERMFTYLKVPDEKLRDKAVESVKERVTSLRQQGFEGGRDEVMRALAEGFSSALSVEFTPGVLTPREIEMAENLKVRKYGSEMWLFRRRLPEGDSLQG